MVKTDSFSAFLLTIATTAILLVGSSSRTARAQSDEDRERTATTLENGRQEAALYNIRPAVADQQPIKLIPDSQLRWHNSVNQIVLGNIFVWTKEGRPEVVASIYRFFSPKVEFAAEFQSLSLTPLVVEKNGTPVWTPKDPGVVLKRFDDTSEPSSVKPQRLIKMRQLAEQFSVQITDWSNETYRLRLLPKPLFRYESTDPEVLDGALFAYTYTTDPEVLVMVEARKTDNGFRWMYGLARMNIGELRVSDRDKEIWKADRLEHPYFYKNGIYTLFMDLPLPKPKTNN